MGCWWVIICSPFSSWNLEYRMLEPLYRYLTTILSFLYRIYNGSITLSTSFCQTIHRSHPSSLYAFIFPTIYYCIQLSSSFLSDTFRTVCILPPNSYITVFIPSTLLSCTVFIPTTYFSLHSSLQLLYHCIHLFNSYITVFISSTLISLYSVLHLFLSLYSSSQHIFTEFMEHHFYHCIYISSSFTAVFISPTIYHCFTLPI